MRKLLPMVPDFAEEDDVSPKDHPAIVPDGCVIRYDMCAREIEAIIRSEYPRLAPGARLTFLAQRIARKCYADTHELNRLFWNPVQGNA